MTNQRPRNYLKLTNWQTDTESTYCQALLYEQRLQKILVITSDMKILNKDNKHPLISVKDRTIFRSGQVEDKLLMIHDVTDINHISSTFLLPSVRQLVRHNGIKIRLFVSATLFCCLTTGISGQGIISMWSCLTT